MSMDKKSYRINSASSLCTSYKLSDNVFFDVDDQTLVFAKKIMADVADRTDQVLVDAIIRTCQEKGIVDCYIIDKTFILEAILEKLEREKNDI